MAEIIPVCPDAPDETDVRRAAEALLRGETVALPTDTIYGLCARAADSAAIEALYAAKGRGAEKGAPVLIGGADQLALLSDPVSRNAQNLMDALWPGPLTLILPARAGLSPFLCEGGGVAVRLPAQALCRAVARAAGPFAATSANRPGESPLGDAQAVADVFGGEIALILDGGTRKSGAPSTLVDARGASPKLLRDGSLPFEQAREVWETGNRD